MTLDDREVLASELIQRLQALIDDRGDRPVRLSVQDYYGNNATLRFSFKKGSPFWEGQYTLRHFSFHLDFPRPEPKKEIHLTKRTVRH